MGVYKGYIKLCRDYMGRCRLYKGYIGDTDASNLAKEVAHPGNIKAATPTLVVIQTESPRGLVLNTHIFSIKTTNCPECVLPECVLPAIHAVLLLSSQ